MKAALHNAGSMRKFLRANASLAAFCLANDTTLIAMTGRCCIKRLTRLRHRAMLHVRRETKIGSPILGAVFNRDHTSILHGLKEAAKREGDAA